MSIFRGFPEKKEAALRKNLSGSWRWIFIVRADRRYWLRVWKKYQEILIDFGEVRDEVFPEWLRCSKKILIADLSEWKLESFLGLFTEKEKTGKDWICLTAFGSEIVRKEIERQFRLSVKRIPLSVDAFSVDIQTMEWFADILV